VSKTDVIAQFAPDHLAVSDKFSAILGCLLGQHWTDPQLVELHITGDGCLLGRLEGDCGCNEFLGAWEDLARNLAGVVDCVGLNAEERQIFAKTAQAHLTCWGPFSVLAAISE
jgi:hypothetical protein